MKRAADAFLFGPGIVLVGAACWCTRWAHEPSAGAAGPPQSATCQTGDSSSGAPASACDPHMVAMRAYRDPVTGAFTDPPAASAGSTAALHAAPSGAAAPLPELPSPGGGTYIDMRGEPMVLVKTPPSKDGGASPARTVDHPAVP